MRDTCLPSLPLVENTASTRRSADPDATRLVRLWLRCRVLVLEIASLMSRRKKKRTMMTPKKGKKNDKEVEEEEKEEEEEG